MSIDPMTASGHELLTALSVRDVTVADPRVIARFAVEPELEERWGALAATIDALELSEATSSADLADADSAPDVDPMPAIRAFRAERGHATAPPLRSRRRTVLVAAALAIAALLTVLLLVRDGVTTPDPRLGGASALEVTPRNEPWLPGAPLRWPAVRGADGYRLELRVAASNAAEPVTIHESNGGTGIAATEWTPDPDVRAKLPKRFEWRVIAFDASNHALATSRWAETWQ